MSKKTSILVFTAISILTLCLVASPIIKGALAKSSLKSLAHVSKVLAEGDGGGDGGGGDGGGGDGGGEEGGGDGGDGGDGSCFPQGTLVAVSHNFFGYAVKQIEDIKSGDQILSVDFSSNKPVVKTAVVQNTFVHPEQTRSLVEIRTKNGARTVSTDNHPFVVNSQNQTKEAKDLKLGDSILVVKKHVVKWETISSLNFFKEESSVYNLEVEDTHNYLVSENKGSFILAHNKGDGGEEGGDGGGTEEHPVDPSALDNPDIIATTDPLDPSGRPPTYVPPDYVYLGTTDDGLNIWGPPSSPTGDGGDGGDGGGGGDTPSPATAHLYANPSKIIKGEDTILSWTIQNVTNCSIDNGIGSVSLNKNNKTALNLNVFKIFKAMAGGGGGEGQPQGHSGQRTVSPSSTTTYTLTCTNSENGQQVKSSAKITVENNEVTDTVEIHVFRYPECNFSANPESIKPLQIAALSWSCSNANNCSISNNIGAVGNSGSKEVRPGETTTYTLTCDGFDGPGSFDATVSVASDAAGKLKMWWKEILPKF